MYITKLELKNFRCFSSKSLHFEKNISCILGPNGIGKTSVLEALHYACYFKSFKASSPKELVKINSPGFAIKIDLQDLSSGDFDSLNINFADGKRVIKFNNNQVASFKDHFSRYTTVTLTEDDLELIKGAPEVRRTFIDQLLIVDDPGYATLLRKFRQILENRNALLENFNGKREMRETREMYELWTKQLWEITILIRKLRLEGLKNLQNEFNFLIENTLQGDFSIQLDYSGDIGENFQDFYDNLLITKYSRECASGRSLFGVHLDDFNIIFKQKSSRIYASRGQQKLIVLFLKLAQLKLISKKYSKTVLLLDDFMTDFDDQIIASIIPALTGLANQLIFTAPSEKNLINSSLSMLEPQLLRL